MLTFLHNRKCSKSKAALVLLNDSRKKYIMREYLKNPLDISELEELQEKLGNIPAIEFTRTKEKEFQLLGLHKESTDAEIFKAMIACPNLMERPIVIADNKAVIGRPVENIKKLFIK
ncbi:MAG: arsenate reductase (glutaredoxin) [Candidatus Gracilibacteria bacterium]|nr:arsenate reductase (glutaredoxin) [Candidatus Gracilibacteria bacterium]